MFLLFTAIGTGCFCNLFLCNKYMSLTRVYCLLSSLIKQGAEDHVPSMPQSSQYLGKGRNPGTVSNSGKDYMIQQAEVWLLDNVDFPLSIMIQSLFRNLQQLFAINIITCRIQNYVATVEVLLIWQGSVRQQLQQTEGKWNLNLQHEQKHRQKAYLKGRLLQECLLEV